MLDKLHQMTGGDKQRMELLITTYKEGIAEYIKLLSSAIANNDLKEIRNAVHTSKPLFTIMGFKELWNAANLIEESIDQETNVSDVPKKSESLLFLMKESLLNLSKY